jgi:hypothetical protein
MSNSKLKETRAMPRLLADEVQAVIAYRNALRANGDAGARVASAPGDERLRRLADTASALVFDARKTLDEVLRG